MFSKKTATLWLYMAVLATSACKPSSNSKLKDIATSTSLKTGIFMPERTEDVAKFSTAFSGSSLSADELMTKLKIDLAAIPAGIRYTIPTREQDLILVVRQAPEARPIPLGGITKDGKLFYLSTTIAHVGETSLIALGKTIYKLQKPDEPLKITVSKDGNTSNAYQIVMVEGGLGGTEEYLVSYLNILQTKDQDPITLVKIGNKLVSPISGKTMIEYREIGHQVWVVGGTISSKHFRNGSVIWSTNMKDFYSVRAKGQPVSLWKRQDNNSMDISAENVQTKIPKVVSDLLTFHASDPDLIANDANITGPTFGTVAIGASSLVERSLGRDSGTSQSGFALTGDDAGLEEAPNPVSAEEFERFFQPGLSDQGLSLDGDVVALPTSAQLAKGDGGTFDMMARRPGARVALPGGGIGRVISVDSYAPNADSNRGQGSDHYLIQDDTTGQVYHLTHDRSVRPGMAGRVYNFFNGRTPEMDAKGRTYSTSLKRLSPSEVATLGDTAQQYRKAQLDAVGESKVLEKQFRADQQSFDASATEYLNKWSPWQVDGQNKGGVNWRGIGNIGLLGASSLLPGKVEADGKYDALASTQNAIVKGTIGLSGAIVNQSGASAFSSGAALPLDMVAATYGGTKYGSLIGHVSSGLKVGLKNGAKGAEGKFDGIDFATDIVAEGVGKFGPIGSAAKPLVEVAAPAAKGVLAARSAGKLAESTERELQNRVLADLYRNGSRNLAVQPQYATMQPTITNRAQSGIWTGSSSPISEKTSQLIKGSQLGSSTSSKPLVLRPVTPATMQSLLPSGSIMNVPTNKTLPSSVSTTPSKSYVSPTTGPSINSSSSPKPSYGFGSTGGPSGGRPSSGPPSSGGIPFGTTMGPSIK